VAFWLWQGAAPALLVSLCACTLLGPILTPPKKTTQPPRYGALLQVLSKGGLKYPVSGAYIWNCASWDVQGIFAGGKEDSYADPVTVQRIKRHNAAVQGVR